MRAPLSGLVSFDSWEARPLGEATIVGIVRTPFDLVHDPSTEHLVIAGPGFLDGDWTELARPGTILFLHLGDRDDVAAVVSDLSTVVEGDVRPVDDILSTAERAADLQRRGLVVAGAVVAAVGLLVISQGVARHLAGRSADKDVLAAIGLTRGERCVAAASCLAPGLLAGMVGGLVVAIGLSPLLPLGMPRRADPAIGFHADLLVLVIGFGAATLIAGAATATAIWRWLRPPPRQISDRPALATRLATALGLRPVPTDRLSPCHRGRTRKAASAGGGHPRGARRDDECSRRFARRRDQSRRPRQRAGTLRPALGHLRREHPRRRARRRRGTFGRRSPNRRRQSRRPGRVERHRRRWEGHPSRLDRSRRSRWSDVVGGSRRASARRAGGDRHRLAHDDPTRTSRRGHHHRRRGVRRARDDRGRPRHRAGHVRWRSGSRIDRHPRRVPRAVCRRIDR